MILSYANTLYQEGRRKNVMKLGKEKRRAHQNRDWIWSSPNWMFEQDWLKEPQPPFVHVPTTASK